VCVCDATYRSRERRVKARAGGRCRPSWTFVCGSASTRSHVTSRIWANCRPATSLATTWTSTTVRPLPSSIKVYRRRHCVYIRVNSRFDVDYISLFIRVKGHHYTTDYGQPVVPSRRGPSVPVLHMMPATHSSTRHRRLWRHSRQYFLSYNPQIASAVAGQQMHGSVSAGNALDTAHEGRLESTPAVL